MLEKKVGKFSGADLVQSQISSKTFREKTTAQNKTP